MIIRKKTNTLALLFAWGGTIFPKVLPAMLLLSSVSLLLGIGAHNHWFHLPTPPVVGFTIFGIVLSLFLGFRNNASYDRWWEGRKLWGQLIATQRHLIRESQILPSARRELVLRQIIVFTHLLRDRLRYQTAHPELFLEYGQMQADQIEAFATHINPPQYALERIQYDLIQAHRQQEISDITYTHLTTHLNTLGMIQAGCDRIASTPVPFAYSVLLSPRHPQLLHYAALWLRSRARLVDTADGGMAGVYVSRAGYAQRAVRRPIRATRQQPTAGFTRAPCRTRNPNRAQRRPTSPRMAA